MIKAIAIDDEPLALNVLKNFCKRNSKVELLHTFTDADKALEYLADNKTDLLFLDIKMPSKNGLQLYKQLPQKISVIFTTAYAEYAVEGFNVSALDYLLKPIAYERFEQAIDKAVAYNNAGTDKLYMFVKADYSMKKVNFADILYIRSVDNYMKLHLVNDKPILTRMNIKDLLEKLPEGFLQVHRSYIIPIDKVTSFKNRKLMIGEEEIPVSTSYADMLEAALK